MSRYEESNHKTVFNSNDGGSWEEMIGCGDANLGRESFGQVNVTVDSVITPIVEFNERAGTECKYRSLDDGDIYAQISLIEEEWNELLTAYEADDRKEVADAACDIIVVATGLLHKLGYNPVKAMSIVNNSNMSKFVDPDNKEDVEASIRKYDEDDRYTDVYVDERGVVWGTVVATGSKKILKGIHYKEPQWHELDPELK